MRRVGRALFRYLIARPWALWAGCGLPALLLQLAYWLPSGSGISQAERDFVVALLDTLGLILIAWGYAGLRSAFGRPSIGRAVIGYVREFAAAVRRPRVIELTANASGAAVLSGHASATVTGGSGQSVERRVELLEWAVKGLQADLRASQVEGDKRFGELRRDLDSATREVATELLAVRVLVEESSIGSPSLEVLGWLWLLSGIWISVAPSIAAVLPIAG